MTFWAVLEGFWGLFGGPSKSSRESGMGLGGLVRTHQNVSKSDGFEQFWRLLETLSKFQSQNSRSVLKPCQGLKFDENEHFLKHFEKSW